MKRIISIIIAMAIAFVFPAMALGQGATGDNTSTENRIVCEVAQKNGLNVNNLEVVQLFDGASSAYAMPRTS